MLIPDLAHQLLQDVLHGDDAAGAAVLIHHHGHVGLGLLELGEELADGLALQGEDHGGKELREGLFRDALADVEVLLVQHAQDIVDAVPVDDEAGVAGLGEARCDLLPAGLQGDGRQVHPVDEDVPGLPVCELDGVFQQLPLTAVNAALLLDLLHQHEKLRLGEAALRPQPEKAGEQTLPLGEEEVQRGEGPHQEAQHGGGEAGEALGTVPGHALGGNLAEDQHRQRHHHGGEGSARVPEAADEEQRAQRGGGDVHDVVADEDGGDETVILAVEMQGQLCPVVPLLRQGAHLGGAQGGEGRLRGGEVGGEQQAQGHQGQGYGGGHRNDSFLSVRFRSCRRKWSQSARKSTPVPLDAARICSTQTDRYGRIGGYCHCPCGRGPPSWRKIECHEYTGKRLSLSRGRGVQTS